MRKISLLTFKILYALVVCSVLALALLFAGTRMSVLGYEVKVVKSGSMEPAIQTGGIVVIAPAASYNVGDVITFGKDTKREVPVTHRIIDKAGEGRSTTYHTKGDANEDPDPMITPHGAIIGKVVATIPYLGYVIEFARTPLGFTLLIGIPAAVVILDEFANIVFEFHKYRLARQRQGPVGYRIPSRERQSRETRPVTTSKPKVTPPPKRPIDSMRTYELKRNVS